MAKRVFNGMLLFAFLATASCFYNPPAFDKKEALSVVRLSRVDLDNFLILKSKLLHDLPALKIINERENTLAYNKPGGYIGTNSYYLNKVDSATYSAILTKLKGKFYDDFVITDAQQVIITLKRTVDFRTGDRNYVYEHLLVSNKWPLDTSKYSDDKTYIDSVINSDWKYRLIQSRSGW